MKSVRENSAPPKANPKKKSEPPITGHDTSDWKYSDHDPVDLTPVMSANLHRMRVKRGLTLEGLAKLCGVSRAMLGQIELGQSTPTINVVWKIARALGVSFSTLISEREKTTSVILGADRAKILRSKDGRFSSRALFPFDGQPRTVEFYELRLAAKGKEVAEAHLPGTTENLIVTAGALQLTIGAESHSLNIGDAIFFEADVAHVYSNPGTVETVIYLVMTYAEPTA